MKADAETTLDYDWRLVADKSECGGAEWQPAGSPAYHVGTCAHMCRGISSMFVFGTNDYGTTRCDEKGACKCWCEIAATRDGTCTIISHSGFRLYKYEKGEIYLTDNDQNINYYIKLKKLRKINHSLNILAIKKSDAVGDQSCDSGLSKDSSCNLKGNLNQ